MLLDKPCANPLINTIAEYFLLKTVAFYQRLSQKRGLKQPFFCYVTKFNKQSRQRGVLFIPRCLKVKTSTEIECKIYKYDN